MKITKNKVRLYNIVQNSVVQHLLYGCAMFLLVYSSFSIYAWQEEWSGFQPDFKKPLDAFLQVWKDAAIYALLMAVPVYANFVFIYKGRIQRLFNTYLIPEVYIKGWGFPLFLIFSLLNAMVFAFLLDALLGLFLNTLLPNSFLVNFLAINFFVFISIGAAYTKETIELKRDLDRKNRRLAIQRQREAELQLSFIKNQIRPHFLFNTLQNLQILALQKSDKLPMLMGKLSILLRYTIYKTDQKFVPIEQELEFLKSYIELERLQLSPKTDLQFEVFRSPSSVSGNVAPMILLVIVENCFKHYNKTNSLEKFIHIKIELNNKMLHLQTRNSFDENSKNEHKKLGGLGLKAVAENLNLLFKDNFTLTQTIEQQYFITNLKMPIVDSI